MHLNLERIRLYYSIKVWNVVVGVEVYSRDVDKVLN